MILVRGTREQQYVDGRLQAERIRCVLSLTPTEIENLRTTQLRLVSHWFLALRPGFVRQNTDYCLDQTGSELHADLTDVLVHPLFPGDPEPLIIEGK